MPYNKPFFEEIQTTDLCDYGCGQIAKYRFRKGTVCCSKHYNSCPKKRKTFSETHDHKENAAKSLETRTRLGITKSSQIKASATRKSSGHYERLSKKMQEHWITNPWQNNLQCPLLEYKNSGVKYQGSFEYDFLEKIEKEKGLSWINDNIKRGPSIWYVDPIDNIERLYISDFLIENTIYEIKSSWTWNRHGKDKVLEEKNKSKLTFAMKQGYSVILVLDKEEITWQ